MSVFRCGTGHSYQLMSTFLMSKAGFLRFFAERSIAKIAIQRLMVQDPRDTSVGLQRLLKMAMRPSSKIVADDMSRMAFSKCISRRKTATTPLNG